MSDPARTGGRRPLVGLLWTQFAPYHVDRCTAVAERLAGRADVLAVEVATASTTYAWSPSTDVPGARKITLFPGRSYQAVGPWQRLRAQFAALRHCNVVCFGISYAEPDIIALSVLLRICGVRCILMTESKFDDLPRRIGRELLKRLLLLPYSAAIVGGHRQVDYVRFLGFGRRRPILEGYDCVGLDRVRQQGGGVAAPGGAAWAERDFVFVGRFVAKKNVPFLLDAYRRYVDLSDAPARRLVLIGGGEMEAQIRARIADLALADHVVLPGFLQADGVTATLARGLALILPSSEEQWGLVVNEALAFNLPAIVSEAVGSRDALVRNLVNGFVVEHGSVEGLARAMLMLASDEALWRRMVAASAERAGLGDTHRIAAAVDQIMFSPAHG